MKNKKIREKRLIAALRYLLYHPDLSPSILSKEWNIPIDLAIEVCASNFGLLVNNGILDFPERFEIIENKSFEKLIELK